MELTSSMQGDSILFTLKGAMSFRDKDNFTPVLDAVGQRCGRQVTLDLSELERVDSFGIGLFLLANEQATANGGHLNLLNPKGEVARVFDLANLDAVLNMNGAAKTMPQTVATRRKGIDWRTLPQEQGGIPCVALSGRLVFAEHQEFEEIIQSLAALPTARVILDLGGLEFMDSAGLSMIMIAREEAEDRGQKLVLRNPRGAVAQLLSLSALEFMVEE